MKFLSLTLILFLVFGIINGQPSFDIKPVTRQLFARNLGSNLAAVHFQGVVFGNGSKYFLKRFKYVNGTDLTGDGALDFEQRLPDTGPFSFDNFIPAGLVNYRYRVYKEISPTNHEPVGDDIAREVVAGDAYIIYGQSNAEAGAITGDVNIYQRNFIRAVGSREAHPAVADYSTWTIAEGSQGSSNSLGSIGQWGLYMANQIVDNKNVPVAILSYPQSGAQLWQLQRDDATPSNLTTPYGRMLQKVINSGLKNSIRGLFFFQGEGDADQNRSTAEYKQYFNWLYDDLKADFTGLGKMYLFQIKSGCGDATPDRALTIQEAQKQLAKEKTDIVLISTNNISNHTDNCHYGLPGYMEIGKRGYNYVKNDFYNTPISPNEISPYPKQAAKGTVNKIQLQLIPEEANYTVDAGFKSMIKLNGSGTYTVNAVTLSGSILEIDFTKTGSDPVTLSVYGKGGQNLPALKNGTGVGLVSFNDLMIDAALPLNLTYWRLLIKNNQPEFSWEVLQNDLFTDFDIQMSADGRKWAPAASVIAKSGKKEQYNFTFSQIMNGIQYFRLAGKQYDGEIVYSHIIKYAEKQDNPKLIVYPNPITDNSVIQYFSPTETTAKVSLFSLQGETLNTQSHKMVKGINYLPLKLIQGMKKGIYLAKLETDQEVCLIKVIY